MASRKPPTDPPGPDGAFAHWKQDVLSLLIRLREYFAKAELVTDSLELMLEKLGSAAIGTAPGGVGQRTVSRGKVSRRKRAPWNLLPPKERRLLEVEAEQGFFLLDFHRRLDGSADARMGESRSFRLTPKLADLIEVLSSGAPGADGLMPWLSPALVAEHLYQLARGRKDTEAKLIRPQSVFMLAHRVRDILYRHAGNPFLIQTRAGGLRLAYRPGAGPVIGGVRP